MKITSEITLKGVDKKDSHEDLIDRVVEKCFEIENLDSDKVYVAITLTTPENIREINKEFRNIDKETDVLSFPIFEKKDIDMLCIKKLESVIFDLTDSLGKRDIATALEVLKNLIYAKEPLQKIIVTLYNHFKRLYLTAAAMYFNKDVITSLQLKPNQTFLVNKYKTQTRYFKPKELRGLLQDLCDLDYQYKNGLIDLQIGMETVLCKYCGK